MVVKEQPKNKWYSPQKLADLANDGFLTMARSSGKAVRTVQTGIVGGFSVIGRVPSTLAKRRRKPAQKTKPAKNGLEPAREKRPLLAPKGKSFPPKEAGRKRPEEPPPTDKKAPEAVSEKKMLKKFKKIAESFKRKLKPAVEEKPFPEQEGKAFQPEGIEHERPERPPVEKEKEMTEKFAEPSEERPFPEQEGKDFQPEGMERERPEQPPLDKMTEKFAELLAEKPKPAVEEKPFPKQIGRDVRPEETTHPPTDKVIKQLLKQYSPQDSIQALELRVALEDLLHGSAAARKSAVKTLICFGRAAEPFLVASLRGTSPPVVETALECLSQIGSPQLVGCIAELFASRDPEQRMLALRAAHRLPDHQARSFLERGTLDPSAKVRRRVLSYLSWRDSSWALAAIRYLYKDPDPEVQWAALEALAAVKPSEAHDCLELLMPTLGPAEQHRAAILLAQRSSRQIDAPPREEMGKGPAPESIKYQAPVEVAVSQPERVQTTPQTGSPTPTPGEIKISPLEDEIPNNVE